MFWYVESIYYPFSREINSRHFLLQYRIIVKHKFSLHKRTRVHIKLISNEIIYNEYRSFQQNMYSVEYLKLCHKPLVHRRCWISPINTLFHMNFLQGRRLANTTSPQIRIPWGAKMICFPLYCSLSGFRNPEAALKVLKSDKANCDYESFLSLLSHSLSFSLPPPVWFNCPTLHDVRFDGIQN